MKLFDYFKQSKARKDAGDLYFRLCEKTYAAYPFEVQDLGEGMAVVNEVITGYWKPRFLLNRRAQCAYEFMDRNECLKCIGSKDIDWDKLAVLPDYAQERAKRLSAHYPTFIRPFSNGVAQVSWQLNPDGYYYMDEDGFGMTDDEEIAIYGFIDKTAKVVVKFQPVDRYEDLRELRAMAESKVR